MPSGAQELVGEKISGAFAMGKPVVVSWEKALRQAAEAAFFKTEARKPRGQYK